MQQYKGLGLDLKLGQLLKGGARSGTPHGIVWSLFFNSFALQHPLPSAALSLALSLESPESLPNKHPGTQILDAWTISLDLTYDTFIASSPGEMFLFQPISFIFCLQSLPEQALNLPFFMSVFENKVICTDF